jgi:hypothetical protein
VIGISLLLFHSIKAGIPIANDVSAKTAKAEVNPKTAMLTPARVPPKAVPNQMVALFLVASFPAFLGERLYMAVRLTAQYEDSRKLSKIFPNAKNGNEAAK